jgi:N6-L-threonylcarbamoyladenine synthase
VDDPTPHRLVLGIESSCDETAAAVVRDGREVLSNVIASQHDLHAEYRGVVPEIASRAHAERVIPVIRRAVAEAGFALDDLSAVAVGNRPGLIGSLLVGVAAAKSLAFGLGVPIVGVDHVQAHLAAGWIGRPGSVPPAPAWPALGLVISGGHSAIYHCQNPTVTRRIGSTIDDAIGEAYDKVAAILGLGFPGGPEVDRLAQTARPRTPGFPISRIAPDSLDFSFSGLKTAALYAFRGVPESPTARSRREARGEPPHGPKMTAPEVAATFQHAAASAVILKLERCLDRYPECRTLLIGGGVSANSELRGRIAELGSRRGVDVRLPAMEFCLDNAAMIAALGHRILADRDWRGDALSLTASPSSAAPTALAGARS